MEALITSNRLIVVLGMHRSGTSAITRGLQVLGVSLGDRFLPPKGDNQKGFWEDSDLNALNMEMLSALGSEWHHLAPIEFGDVDALRKKGYFDRAVNLLRRKVGNTPVFGFKDPRVAKLLPFWKAIFSNCQLDVSYVLVVRHPLSVARSLGRRDGFHAEKTYLLWLGYVISSLTGTAGEKRVLIDYDLLMNSPEHELNRIARHLDLEINAAELQRYRSEFLDAGLRHTVYDLNELSSDDTCPPLVRKIYTTLLDVASDKTKITDVAMQNKVEQWVGEFDRNKSYLTLVDTIYIEKEAVAQAVDERDEQIKALNRATAQRDEQIKALNRATAQRDEKIVSLHQTIVERDKQILNLNIGVNAYNNSTSWRITRPVRAAGKMLRKIASVVKTERSLVDSIDPINGVLVTDGQYENQGGDPQLILYPSGKMFRAGWKLLALNVLNTEEPLRARLYLDTGGNYNENDTVRLHDLQTGLVRQLFFLPQDSRTLRFDPTDNERQFRICDIDIHNISKPGIFAIALRHNVRRQRALSWVNKVVRTLVTDGTKAAKRAIVRELIDPMGALTLDGAEPISVNRIAPKARKIDIIVPVYRGLDETRACIESLLSSHQSTANEIIVINDSSPEPGLVAYLEKLSEKGAITLLHNPENLGFVGTVNRGMQIHPKRDVLLLNSDTEVANDWLDRLYACAYANPLIATVTPFSNNATICSYPHNCRDNQLPHGQTVVSLDATFAEVNSGTFVEIPTAVGFCMYIRRDCLDLIGLFDIETFGKGYGEENDFCLRASSAGRRHVLAADVFVYHAGAVSFSNNSNPAKELAMDVLRSRYPYYDYRVQRHVAEDPARKYRNLVTAHRFRDSGIPVLLYVTHGLGGGTEKHIHDLVSLIGSKAHVLVLRSDIDGWVSLAALDAAEEITLRVNMYAQLEDLTRIILAIGVNRLHLHQIIGFDVGLVRRLVSDLSLPFDVTIHDYYTVCPRINLLSKKGGYCGEPGNKACNDCLRDTRGRRSMLIETWRAQHAWLIEDADRVIAPSEDVSRRMTRYYPAREIVVVPHPELGNSGTWPEVRKGIISEDEPLRVLVVGVLAIHKGLAQFETCVAEAQDEGLPLEFHLLGYPDLPLKKLSAKFMRVHGEYEEADVQRLIIEIDAHVVWFPAQWPETFSYTLSVALRAGLPVVVPDIGAFPERLHGRDYSWVVDWNAGAEDITRLFVKIRSEYFRRDQSPKQWLQNGSAGGHDFYTAEYIVPEKRVTPDGLIDLRTRGRISVIAVVPKHNNGAPDACAYIRLALPLAHKSMEDLIDFRILSLNQVQRYISDILVTQRDAITSMEAAEALIAHCQEHGIRMVYEIDDNLFDLSQSHPEKDYYQRLMGPARRFAESADMILVSTEELRRRVLGHNTNVKLLPNALDETLWGVGADIDTRFKQAEQAVRILYMGTMTHGNDLAMLERPITRLKEEYGDRITFEIIGVVPEDHDAWYKALIVPPGVEGDYREFVKWLGSQSRWDIGVAPLVDNQFNSCKSHIKYLDYTALGLASVCSNVTPYNETIDNGLTGILVENNSEAWHQAIKRLMDDALYRRELVARAHKDLCTKYTLDAQSEMRKGIWKEISSTKSIRMIHGDKVEASNRNRKRIRDEIAPILENIGTAERSIRDDGVGGKLAAAYYYMNKRRIFYRLSSMISPRLRQRVKTILIGDHFSGGIQ